jgi:hypothetical protein
MRLRKVSVISGVILVLGGLGYWAISTALRGEPVCQVCARPIHAGQEYTLRLTDGTEEHTCCPRCGLHFQITNADRVQAARATDYATAAKIDPQQASYVEGSTLMTCCSTPPLKRELETAYELVWDRCLPSLIAFKTEIEAQRFQQRYGGRLLSYAEAVQSIRER